MKKCPRGIRRTKACACYQMMYEDNILVLGNDDITNFPLHSTPLLSSPLLPCPVLSCPVPSYPLLGGKEKKTMKLNRKSRISTEPVRHAIVRIYTLITITTYAFRLEEGAKTFHRWLAVLLFFFRGTRVLNFRGTWVLNLRGTWVLNFRGPSRHYYHHP